MYHFMAYTGVYSPSASQQGILNVEQKFDHISVLDDVFFSFRALLAPASYGCIVIIRRLQILKPDDLGADESAFEIRMDLSSWGALVPFLIVHARHSFFPSVRKEISPSSS